MNRQEPYIGMPILLPSLDEERTRQKQAQKSQPAMTVATAPAPAPAAACNTACSAVETRQPMALAMAYVPWQRWQETYPLEKGFHHGTIFPELDLPFEGKNWGGMRK